jgi:hypothetical protein
VHAGVAAGAFVNIIHDLLKGKGAAVYHRNAERASARGASLVTGGVADGADMVAHPAKAAGVNVLLGFIGHIHNILTS